MRPTISSSKVLKGLRFLTLVLVFATGVATGGVGMVICPYHFAWITDSFFIALNCLNKGKDEQDRINENLPNEACTRLFFLPCTSVNIDVKGELRSFISALGFLLTLRRQILQTLR